MMNIQQFFVGRALVSFILLIIFIAIGGFYFLNDYIYKEKQAPTITDYKDATYVIDGQIISLVDGVSEVEAAPGSASKITTRYFGNDLIIDLNNDGRDDVVFLLTQETGGSGVFFYVVAALNTTDGYRGSEGLLLGDRISPQMIERSQEPKHKNVVVVNYVDRKTGEPMTAQPSIGKSIWLKLDIESMQFGEVVQNFEGEVDTSLIKVDLPYRNAVVGKEFKVIGQARGSWFFEASFPIDLIDPNGKILTTGIAQAQSDWMTENFVDFSADMKVPDTYIGPATLVLRKDNPSGLPQYDASIFIEIVVEY